jgi:PAS domain S-box-containing protein
MSSAVVTVSLSASLEEVERLFIDKRITAIPVIGKNDRIIGVVSDFALVKMFLRRATIKSANKSGLNLQFFADDLDAVVTIEDEEPITNAFRLIAQSPTHRLFAVRGGRISGALSPKDIIPFLAGDHRPKETFNRLEEARKKIDELLRELSAEQLKAKTYYQFFENAPFMLHALDFTGKIVMANKMAHIVLGLREGELINQSYTAIYPEELHNKVREALFLIQSNGYNPPVNSMMLKKDGTQIAVEMASMLRKDEEGRPISTITVSRPAEQINMLDYLKAISGEAAPTGNPNPAAS